MNGTNASARRFKTGSGSSVPSRLRRKSIGNASGNSEEAMAATNSSSFVAAWRKTAAGLIPSREPIAARLVASKPRSENSSRAARKTSARLTCGFLPIG